MHWGSRSRRGFLRGKDGFLGPGWTRLLLVISLYLWNLDNCECAFLGLLLSLSAFFGFEVDVGDFLVKLCWKVFKVQRY